MIRPLLLFAPALARLLRIVDQAWKERLSAIGEVVTLITINARRPAAAIPCLFDRRDQRPHKRRRSLSNAVSRREKHGGRIGCHLSLKRR